MQARAKLGRNDTAPPWLRTGSPASTRERRPASGVADRAVAAVAAGTAGNRNLRRTRYFRPRGTSSLPPRATTAASDEKNVSG